MNSDDDKKKRKNTKKSHPYLIIPNPIEFFSNTYLKRPPSVPILSRKLSCDNTSPFCEENTTIGIPKSFKKTRRRSAVDLLAIKQEKTHKKAESKLKLLKKNNEPKPCLQKKHKKLIFIEEKGLNKESLIASSQAKTRKKFLNKIEITSPGLTLMTEDKRSDMVTPNKLIKKLTDLRKQQNQELKRIEKELIHKTVENLRLNKQEKYKKNLPNENKSSLLILKNQNTKNRLNFEESPGRKEKLKKDKLKKDRQKSPIDAPKKKPKKKGKKDLKKTEKKKIKKNLKEKFIEKSFCSPNDLSFGDKGKESGWQSSMAPSTECNFISPPVEKYTKKDQLDQDIRNIPEIIEKSPLRRVKILKKPVKANDLFRETQAVKIQSMVRGWLGRKRAKKIKEIQKILNYESKSDSLDLYNIIDQLNRSFTSEQDIPEKLLFKGNDKSDYQAPGPSEVLEYKEDEEEHKGLNAESVERGFENIQIFGLGTIAKMNEKGDEKEICELFSNIINKRYEQIYSMFDDNIKAVKEALASVIVEESVLVKDEPFTEIEEKGLFDKRENQVSKAEKIEKNNEKRLYKKNSSSHKANGIDLKSVIRTVSPEINKAYCEFPKGANKLNKFLDDLEPVLPEVNIYTNFSFDSHSDLFWMDEVVMPKGTDFAGLVLSSVLEGLTEAIFNEIWESYFLVEPGFIFDLSESIIESLLSKELSKIQAKQQFNEEAIFSVIQKVFTKTQGLIIEEILKPFERNPLSVLEEIQETEIGSGFFNTEKYSMLNLEAFCDEIYTENENLTIFNKLIFDCMNDCLEQLIVKEDLPWAIVKYKRVKARTPEKVVHFIVDRIIKFSEITSGQIDFKGNEGQVIGRRNEDTLKMIISEIEENEEDWIRYEKEETQSLLDIADLILETEVEDIIEFLFNKLA